MSDSPRWCAKCSTNGYHHTDRCPSNQPASSPYRFTVSVKRSEGNVFTWWAVHLNERGLSANSEHLSEAEARSHAAQVLAALHQATLEGDES